MANETLARRYAQAVFALASDAKAVESVGRDLATIAQAIGSDASIRSFFVAPVVDRGDKERALSATFDGKVNEIAMHTLLLLVRKRREAILDSLVAEYRKLERAARSAEPLTVTTARDLSQDELRALVARLEGIYKKSFDVKVRIDPSLIGGARIAMGDRVIDGSVSGRLEELGRDLFTTN